MKRVVTAIVVLGALVPTPVTSQSPRDVTGTWAQLISTVSLSEIPVIGDVENTTRLYSLVRMRQVDTAVEVRAEPCWARIDGPTSKFRTIIPEAMMKAIGPRERTATLVGQEFAMRRSVDVVGAQLDDEWRGALPEVPEDVAVIDEDNDGHPGVTVRIVGIVDGEIRVVQRTWNELNGELDDEGNRVEGRVRWKTEQRVLGATSRLLDANPKSRPHPDPERSRFSLVRVAESSTCTDLIQKHRAIWPTFHED